MNPSLAPWHDSVLFNTTAPAAQAECRRDPQVLRPQAGLYGQAINVHQEHFADATLGYLFCGMASVDRLCLPWRQLEKHDLEDVTTYIQALQAPELHVALTPGDAASVGEVFTGRALSLPWDRSKPGQRAGLG